LASEENLTMMADEDSNEAIVINISYEKDVLMNTGLEKLFSWVYSWKFIFGKVKKRSVICEKLQVIYYGKSLNNFSQKMSIVSCSDKLLQDRVSTDPFRQISETVIYKWKVEDFQSLKNEIPVHNREISNIFNCGGSKWLFNLTIRELEFYPNGYSKARYLSLFIALVDESEEQIIDAAYGLGIRNVINGETLVFNSCINRTFSIGTTMHGNSWGWSMICSHNALVTKSLIENGMFEIVCVLKVMKPLSIPYFSAYTYYSSILSNSRCEESVNLLVGKNKVSFVINKIILNKLQYFKELGNEIVLEEEDAEIVGYFVEFIHHGSFTCRECHCLTEMKIYAEIYIFSEKIRFVEFTNHINETLKVLIRKLNVYQEMIFWNYVYLKGDSGSSLRIPCFKGEMKINKKSLLEIYRKRPEEVKKILKEEIEFTIDLLLLS
jgi:hypothetical protein